MFTGGLEGRGDRIRSCEAELRGRDMRSGVRQAWLHLENVILGKLINFLSEFTN